MPKENLLLFYVKRIWEYSSTYARAAIYYLWLDRMRKRIDRDPNAAAYTDAALAGPDPAPDSADQFRPLTESHSHAPGTSRRLRREEVVPLRL